MPVTCKNGYRRSTTDKKKRCIKIVNRSTCIKYKPKKEYNNKSNKCRIPCKNNQTRKVRINRKTGRPKGSYCIKK